MRLNEKGIKNCRDPLQYNVMKFWVLKDPDTLEEKINAIEKINSYLALLCAQSAGEMEEKLSIKINSYIDNRLHGRITSKRQFSQFLLVKLKLGYYQDCKKMLFNPSLFDYLTISDVIEGLMNDDNCSKSLVVFFAILLKARYEYVPDFLRKMEDFDLFFERDESNKEFFDTAIGYTVQRKDFQSLRLFFGNKHTLEKLFNIHSDYCGWAQLCYASEKLFFELALTDRTNSELYLMAEYITDKLCITNHLDMKYIPNNSKASSEVYEYVKELHNKFIAEHGYSVPTPEVLNSHSYYVMNEIESMKKLFQSIHK